MNEIEDRLRAALRARADAVEPQRLPGDVDALAPRAAAAHRRTTQRRAVLAVAAAIVVVAGVVGGVVVAGDDDTGEPLDVAGPDDPPTAPIAEAPAVWPLSTMSVSYANPADAARSFLQEFAGLTFPCVDVADLPGDDRQVELHPCGEPEHSTLVSVRDDSPRGWVVTGATGETVPVREPARGAAVPTRFDVEVGTDEPDSVRLDLRDLGTLDPHDTADLLGGGNRTFFEVLASHPGPQVLVVDDGRTATVLVVHPAAGDDTDPDGAPSTTTTQLVEAPVPLEPDPATTCGQELGEGEHGWPGADGGSLASVEEAALAFAVEVLDLPDPAVESVDGGRVAIRARPGAGPLTTIGVADVGAGALRVLCASSDLGTLESPAPGAAVGPAVTVTGQATAFEGTVTVQALALDGTILAETHTQAGSMGVVAGYEATLDVPPGSGTGFLLIAEGDASGEGRFSWATVVEVTFA